ncbi:MAG: ribulose-phosphate 3-epimerase [Mycoplasma sp.]
MNNKKIEPSLLAFNFEKLDAELLWLKENGVSVIHYDVMDSYVGNTSFGNEFIEKIISYGFQINVHLMVHKPLDWIHDFCSLPINALTFQYEAIGLVESIYCINEIKKYNIKAGIAIKPYSTPNEYKKILHECDIVTIMTVEPGKGGQSLMPIAVENLKFVHAYKQLSKLNYLIEVDGGIKFDNFDTIFKWSDLIISGTGLMNLDFENRVKFIKAIQGE